MQVARIQRKFSFLKIIQDLSLHFSNFYEWALEHFSRLTFSRALKLLKEKLEIWDAYISETEHFCPR